MRRGALLLEITALTTCAAAIALVLAGIAADRAAAARLERRAAAQELLQNALEAARRQRAPGLPAGWTLAVTPLAGGVEAVTVTTADGRRATTLRRRAAP